MADEGFTLGQHEVPSQDPANDIGRISPRLLELLVCPLTRGLLRYDAAAQELISDKARLAYPLRNGIAFMLVDEARPLEP